MGNFNPIVIILQILVIGLAILMMIFGMSTGILGGEPQELWFASPEGVTHPEDGYVTPVYDPWTTATVTVESREEVEVHLYSSNYRGGKVVKNASNESVIRDEWLAAGEEEERIGTNMVLSGFTSVSSQYMVDVVYTDMSVQSDADYKIRIEAKTTDTGLITWASSSWDGPGSS